MGVIQDLAAQTRGIRAINPSVLHPMETPVHWSEKGYRSTPENAAKYLYRLMWVDPDLRAAVLDIRDMDKRDGRVKKIHKRTAESVVKGGLLLKTSSQNKRIIKAWKDFEKKVGLSKAQKLQSDARGLMMEGNLALQIVLDGSGQVGRVVRMASETLLPRVHANGTFIDPKKAWEQYDLTTGTLIAQFPLWQLEVVRLLPDNYDDFGSMGRPYLDADRPVWKKLTMSEDDLVIRRRTRAPLRMSHVLEGADKDDLDVYRDSIERDQNQITTDFYTNRKGGVSAVQGDANMDQIADVVHLLDTFFAGSPAPKALFGYTEGMNRDILEDLKRDYFDEIDSLQDTLADGYAQVFRLHLLLKGINPDSTDYELVFKERRTDTPNQRADLGLKHQAMGVPKEMVWTAAGLDPAAVRAQREAEADDDDPYPGDDPAAFGRRPQRVAVTPGNAPKGESATTISTRG